MCIVRCAAASGLIALAGRGCKVRMLSLLSVNRSRSHRSRHRNSGGKVWRQILGGAEFRVASTLLLGFLAARAA